MFCIGYTETLWFLFIPFRTGDGEAARTNHGFSGPLAASPQGKHSLGNYLFWQFILRSMTHSISKVTHLEIVTNDKDLNSRFG